MAKKNLEIFLSILTYALVFVFSLSYSQDPDLGWHLKYGEHFIKTGEVLRENLYSTQMPDFLWANGGWLSDVLIYLIFQNFGFLGLTIGGALVVTTTFYFFGNAVRMPTSLKSILYPIIGYLLLNINSSSLRGQQLSLLFLGILIFLLFRVSKKFSRMNNSRTELILLPSLFLIWANLHQQSLMGLGVFFMWVIFSFFFVSRREFLFLILTFLLSLIATFINPFGIGIYFDFIAHVTDPLVKTVSEYMPFEVSTEDWWFHFLALIVSVSVLSYTFYKKEKKLLLRVEIITVIFLSLALFNRRFAWPGYYLLIPLLAIFFARFKFRIEKINVIIVIYLLVLIIQVLSTKLAMVTYPENWENYCMRLRTPCSPRAAEFLTSIGGNRLTYTYYNWGGWLIWNYPQVKPSTDGRMHLWRDRHGFGAYEYDYNLEIGKESIHKSDYDSVLIPKYKTGLYREIAKLTAQRKWKLVYEDDVSVVVVRVIQK